MKTYASPVVRCQHCDGWLTQRSLDTHEAPTLALTCAWCGRDYEILGGKLVSMSRPASTLTDQDMRRERHALAVEATTLRKRSEAGT